MVLNFPIDPEMRKPYHKIRKMHLLLSKLLIFLSFFLLACFSRFSIFIGFISLLLYLISSFYSYCACDAQTSRVRAHKHAHTHTYVCMYVLKKCFCGDFLENDIGSRHKIPLSTILFGNRIVHIDLHIPNSNILRFKWTIRVNSVYWLDNATADCWQAGTSQNR